MIAVICRGHPFSPKMSVFTKVTGQSLPGHSLPVSWSGLGYGLRLGFGLECRWVYDRMHVTGGKCFKTVYQMLDILGMVQVESEAK